VNADLRDYIRRELHLRAEQRLQACEEPYARVRGDRTQCSRCLEPMTPETRSPRRAWCKSCENERKREQYRTRKALA
jgi:hypothetical protein